MENGILTDQKAEMTGGILQEGLYTPPTDPLALEIEDDELVRIVDRQKRETRTFYANEYDLYNRRRENELYVFGRQIKDKEDNRQLKPYESRYMDNVLYEIEATIKPLAMSRLPDLIVTPGNDSDEAEMMAQEVSKAVDTAIKDRNNRRVLGIATKHHPVYFTAVIKSVWNAQRDDYEFINIHPDDVDVDYTCTTNQADDMRYIIQTCTNTVEEIIMRFPKAKDKFFAQLKKDGLMVDEKPTWKTLATSLKYSEVWFTWYKKHSETEWEAVEGVLWKYKDCILAKMKNPNYDYEGETRFFSYQDDKKKPLSMDDVSGIFQTGQIPDHIKEEKVYHNYFMFPRKPFFFMGYDQWGKQPYDETSRVEQNIHNQMALDKRGKQVEETLNNRGKNVFSKEAGLTASEVEAMDFADPDEDIVVDGNVNDTHKFIEPARPTAQEFEEISNIRNRMYSIAGSNAVRGQIQSQVATTNQIARESDFTRADDLVEDTINAAAQWMAEWALQFIKLRYTEDHFVKLLGIAGKVVFMKLNRNMIDDGMIVKIKASGTDKLRAQNNAMDMAKMEMIDPHTFFVDMGLSDPDGRTEKLIIAKQDPIAYLQKVVKGIDTSQALAQALMNAELPPPAAPAQPPAMPPGMPPPAPQPGMNPLMANQQAAQPPQAGAPSSSNTTQVPIAPPSGAPVGSPRGM